MDKSQVILPLLFNRYSSSECLICFLEQIHSKTGHYRFTKQLLVIWSVGLWRELQLLCVLHVSNSSSKEPHCFWKYSGIRPKGEPTFYHTKVHSNYTELLAVKNWSFLSPLTWEFWQGCPEQISVVFLCQILTGQAALCFNFFSSTGNCRRKEKNKQN